MATQLMTTEKYAEFCELPVFQETYRASLAVMTWVVPYLPEGKTDDLAGRLERAASAIPRLIASGTVEMMQEQGIPDSFALALQYCHEAVVMLLHCRDLYSRHVNGCLCDDLIELYQRCGIDLAQGMRCPADAPEQKGNSA